MIERFKPSFELSNMGGNAVMRREPAGEWVRYADYLAIEARVEVLEGKIGLAQEGFNGTELG